MKIKEIKPLYNKILTTLNKIEELQTDENGVIDTSKQSGAVDEYQTVISIGTTVRDIKVGDIVKINPTAYAVKQHREDSLKDGIVTDNVIIGYDLPIIEVNNEDCLLLSDRDIEFIVVS